jgi:hypothetical protein
LTVVRIDRRLAIVIVASVVLACGAPAPSSSQAVASPIILAAAEAAFGPFDPVVMFHVPANGARCAFGTVVTVGASSTTSFGAGSGSMKWI